MKTFVTIYFVINEIYNCKMLLSTSIFYLTSIHTLCTYNFYIHLLQSLRIYRHEISNLNPSFVTCITLFDVFYQYRMHLVFWFFTIDFLFCTRCVWNNHFHGNSIARTYILWFIIIFGFQYWARISLIKENNLWILVWILVYVIIEYDK